MVSIYSFFLVTLSVTWAHATKFNITNNCPNTVWAAAVPGGGRKLDNGQTWTITAEPGTTRARIWARTNCQFDASGKGKCETGDCNGLLECQGYGAAPNTLAEYALKQFNDMDFIDMSNIDGFNVPMEFSSVSPSCNRVIKCTANILGECPNELKVPGGCNGPCHVFKTDKYCCNSGNCGPTNFSRFFKERCPDVYSYPKDDATSVFTCPSGTDYKVVFCPSLTRLSKGLDFCGSTSMDIIFGGFMIGSEIGLFSLKGPLLLPSPIGLVFIGAIFFGPCFIESAFVRSFICDTNKCTPFSWASEASFM